MVVSAQLSREVTTRQQGVFAALPEIILQIDSDRWIRTVNRPKASILQSAPVLGHPLDEFLDQKVLALVMGLLEETRR